MRKVLVVAAVTALALGSAFAADKPQAKPQAKAVKMTDAQMARQTAAGYDVITRGAGTVGASTVAAQGAVALCTYGKGSSATSAFCAP